MKRQGVTFERFYPTVVIEVESDNENVEREEKAGTDSEWEEVDNIIEEADDENVKGEEEEVETINAQEDMESVEGEEEVENINEHDHRENVEGELELELVNINREDKADDEIVAGEVEGEENIEGKSEAIAAAEAEIVIATAAEAEPEVEDEAGWEVKKRLYLLGWKTIVPEHGKRKKFFSLIVRHCLKGGPVIGEVACSDDFDTRFYSKKGYDFILNIEKQDEGLNLNRAQLVRDKEEPEIDIAVEGHQIVIIGYGFVRHRLRFSDPRLRKLRREIFLVQDSSLPTAGSFQNGLAIVFSSSVRQVHVPFFSGLYRRKTEWQKEQEEKKRVRFWKNLFKKN